jgi:hypothetical protein
MTVPPPDDPARAAGDADQEPTKAAREEGHEGAGADNLQGAQDARAGVANSNAAPIARLNRFFITCTKAGEDLISIEPSAVPGGRRIIVNYSKGIVRYTADPTSDQIGVVLNGGDWILVRDDGVVVFDAHFTIGKRKLDADVLQDIAAALRRELGLQELAVSLGRALGRQDSAEALARKLGRPDIAAALGRERSRQDIAKTYRREADEDWPVEDFVLDLFIAGQAPLLNKPVWDQALVDIDFALPVRVEGATRAPPWVKARFTQLAEGAERFAELTQHQCLAIGKLTMSKGLVTELSFEVRAIKRNGNGVDLV